MAIVQLRKLNLYGMKGQEQAVLDQLQQLGCVHLVPLRDLPDSTRSGGPPEANKAYRYLLQTPQQRRPATDAAKFDRESLVNDTLRIKNRLAALTAERDEILHAIELLVPWGEFNLPTQEVVGFRFWFYRVPLRQHDQLQHDQVFQVVNRDNRFLYVVVIANQEPLDFPGERIELDSRPLSELRQRSEQIEEEMEELHWQRTTLTRWRNLLRNDLDAAADHDDKVEAAGGLRQDDHVFALQGWIPEIATKDVRELAERHQLAVIMAEPRADESPPTLLHNPERIAGAEKLVTFYITPGYQAWDPTPVVFVSFCLFFAMIIADAGYGLMMALLMALAWRKFSHNRAGARARDVLIGIISATITYGVLVGSYFGMEPRPGSFLDIVRIRINGDPMMENQNAMMLIAVAIGVTHLALANTLTAFRKRRTLRSLGHFGWALVIVGVFLLAMGFYAATNSLVTIGIVMASLGGAAILLFSSERPWLTTDWKNPVMRLVEGLMQFTNLSKAFGDVLSYLRLFALGLASAQLAITFNSMAAGVNQRGGIGILFALLILLVGHGINFLLGLVGGVVHGLRLNCIEFFNWGLSEEGYAFQPFRKRTNH